jgi:hypothetical protein
MQSIRDFLLMNEAEEFDTIADKIINGVCLVIRNGADEHVFRIAEIEFYLHSAEHPDPYVHQSQDQLDVGRWYFHRVGESYRGGTFKGLDITFAHGMYGGILIRSLVAADGEIIEGPSLCVDRILKTAAFESVASLAAAVDHVDTWVWTETSPIFLRELQPQLLPINPVNLINPVNHPPQLGDRMYTSARVGLNADKSPEFAAMPYRYISAAHIRSIKKSRTSIIAGLREFHGLTSGDITALIGRVGKK